MITINSSVYSLVPFLYYYYCYISSQNEEDGVGSNKKEWGVR